MPPRLFILREFPVSKRDYDRIVVDLLSEYFSVTVLDCTPWLHSDFWQRYSSWAYHHPGYVSVSAMGELLPHLGAGPEAVAIDYLADSPPSRRIRTELKKRGIPRAIVQPGLVPTLPNTETRSQRVRRILSSPLALPGRVVDRVRGHLDPQLPEMAVLSGAAGLGEWVRDVPHKIWTHSFDYDLYLSLRGDAAAGVQPYAVFLDEDMAFHTDYDFLGLELPVTPERYYSALNRFFDRFQREAGLPVVVAGHPRHVRPGMWEERTPVYNQTAELVRDAAIVLGHASTSISFAVLWSKPVVCLTTSELSRSSTGARIELVSGILSAPLIDVDAPGAALHSDAFRHVNQAAYDRYQQDYIKRPGTPDLPVWRIFSEYVRANVL